MKNVRLWVDGKPGLTDFYLVYLGNEGERNRTLTNILNSDPPSYRLSEMYLLELGCLNINIHINTLFYVLSVTSVY